MLHCPRVSMLRGPISDGAEQRVVPLEHRVRGAAVRGEETHRLEVAIASEAGHGKQTAAEGHDDGAIVLPRAKVFHPAEHAPPSSDQQDPLLKHGRRGAVPTKSVSVRLPVTDIERARKLAEKRGVGYQTVIKTLLHEALKKESKIA